MIERFKLLDVREMRVDLPPPIAGMYTLSPYVWKDNGVFRLLLRVVNRDDDPDKKVARIHYGEGASGIEFAVDSEPVIGPGPAADDLGGCEDPTLWFSDGNYWCYYTGWNPKARCALLLHAVGPDIHQLRKRGPVLPPSDIYQWSKEVTIAPVADGTWRLLFEYSHDERSKIGIASAAHPGGPWSYGEPSLFAREDRWDSWHLSTGPVIFLDNDEPIMFYNGATRDARWRIGWAAFNADFTRVTARGDEPLIDPGEVHGVDTDIAFAASAVAIDGDIFVYYSVSDRVLMRATVRATR